MVGREENREAPFDSEGQNRNPRKGYILASLVDYRRCSLCCLHFNTSHVFFIWFCFSWFWLVSNPEDGEGKLN